MTDMTTLDALDGLIDADIGHALYEHAARVPADQAIVELGSYRGKSTCYLAAGAADGHGARVWAVDAWSEGVSAWRKAVADRLPSPEFADFDAQLVACGLRERVTAIQSLTVDAARGYDGPPVGLLYIDADHAKEAALADFRAWRPHLAPVATVVFDDYDTRTNPGVLAAVRTLVDAGEYVRVAKQAGRLAVGGVA